MGLIRLFQAKKEIFTAVGHYVALTVINVVAIVVEWGAIWLNHDATSFGKDNIASGNVPFFRSRAFANEKIFASVRD